MEYRLKPAAKAFQKHRWMLQCQECSIKHRLRYFEAIVSSTACFAAEHRPLYRKHLQKYDVQFRKLIRRIVGPPPGTNWSAQWHDILHERNLRVDHWARASGISSRGRPQQTWDPKLEMFCRFKALGNWESVARNAVQWDVLLPTFLDFCSMYTLLPRFLRDACKLYSHWYVHTYIFFPPPPLHWARLRVLGLT